MSSYSCIITISWAGNNLEAKNKTDYIKMLKEQFLEDFNIELDNDEITQIVKEKK